MLYATALHVAKKSRALVYLHDTSTLHVIETQCLTLLRCTSLHKYFQSFSFHSNKPNSIPCFLASFAQRLDFRIRPLNAQVVPILRLVLAPILLLHGLQATYFSRVACAAVYYEGCTAWQRLVDLRNVLDGSGDSDAKLGAFEFDVYVRVFSQQADTLHCILTNSFDIGGLCIIPPPSRKFKFAETGPDEVDVHSSTLLSYCATLQDTVDSLDNLIVRFAAYRDSRLVTVTSIWLAPVDYSAIAVFVV
jgi:hypothetical protein